MTKPGLEESSVVLYTDDPVNLAVHTGRRKVLVLMKRLICHIALTQVTAKEGVSTILPCLPTHPGERRAYIL